MTPASLPPEENTGTGRRGPRAGRDVIRREKSLACAGIRTPGLPTRSRVATCHSSFAMVTNSLFLCTLIAYFNSVISLSGI